MGFLSLKIPVPDHSCLVTSMEEFYKYAKFLAHFAVRRKPGYFHHYIVIAWKNAQKQMLEYFVGFATWVMGGGQIKEQNLKKKDIEQDIKDGNLYVIENPGCPKQMMKKNPAYTRFQKRLHERAYDLTCNNCEHLVSYVLTGLPGSEQIRKAGKWVRCLGDAANVLIQGAWNALKCSGCFIASYPAERFMSVAVSTVVDNFSMGSTAAESAVQNCSGMSGPARATKTLCKSAAKKINKLNKMSCQTKDILKNKKCVDAAQTASKDAIKKTAKTTFIITGAVEGTLAAYDIYCLKQLKEKQYIGENEYHRAVTTTIAGATGATLGSVVGGALAQALIPVPGWGFFIGSFLGNFAGRSAASVSAGQIYDEVTSS